MNNQENHPLLKIKEVSELLGISVSRINHLIAMATFLKKSKFPLKE